MTTENEKPSLYTTCPHCGKKILSMVGLFVSMDPTDERHAATIGLKRACDCDTAKHLAKEEKAQEEAKEREKTAKERIKAERTRFINAGMPENWQQERGLNRWTKDDASRQQAYDAAVCFGVGMSTRTAPRSLYIVGDIGAGKTFLCSCLCADLVRRKVRVLWRNVSDILREIRASFGKKENREQEVMASFMKPAVLVLDDLGKERPTEWAVEQLFAVLNARYDARKPVIVTTNYGGEELVKRLTPRGESDDTTARAIVDRLRGTCKCVKLEGSSRRTYETGA